MTPSGSVGRLGRLGDLRLDVAVVAQHLHRRLQAQAGLGLLDLGAPGALAHLVEPTLRLRPLVALRVEPGRHGTDAFAVLTTLLRQVAVDAVDHGAAVLDEAGQAGERSEVRSIDVRRSSALLRASLVGEQTALRLGEPLGENCRPLAQPGEAHVEVVAPTAEDGGAGIERRSQRLLVAHRLRLGRLPGLQRRAPPPPARRCARRRPR